MVDADTSPPAPPDELVLAGEFPAATREQWAALVDGVLRKSGRIGPDAEAGVGVDKLVRRTPEGIPVAPLYTAADVVDLPPIGVPGRPPFVRGATADGPVPDGWDVRARHVEVDPDPRGAHEAVLADLGNGATSIWLATGDGSELPTVLDGVLLDLAPTALDTGGADTGAAAAYLAHAVGALADPAALLGTLGLDPIGLRARTGVGPDVASVVPLARRVAAEHPLVRAIVVDATGVHAAGGADAQELGFSIAAGVAYLRALTDAGLDVATAARLLEFRYAATDEQFPTIAKLRAARRLWARVLSACGVDDAGGQHQHAVSSPTMFTRRDPYVNLLRGTIAGFAAGVGRRRRGHGRPVRRGAGGLHALRAPGRAQHPGAPDPGGARRAGDRPGRRIVARGVAHRRPRPRRVGVLPGARGGGRRRRRARRRPGRGPRRGGAGRRGRRRWPPGAPRSPA